MLTKTRSSLIRSLHQKKFREQEGLFLAEGRKVVNELLTSDYEVVWLLAVPHSLEGFHEALLSKAGEIIEVSDREMERISALATPTEVLAVARIPEPVFDPVDLKGSLTLLIDDVRDPGNLGTIIRIAHWFGVRQLVCSLNSVDAFNPKVVQAAMGSLFHVPIHYMGLEGMLSGSVIGTGIPILSSVLDGQDVNGMVQMKEAIIVLGNESTGIRTSILEMSTHRVTIPSYELHQGNRPDSLNVAVSAALLLSALRSTKN